MKTPMLHYDREQDMLYVVLRAGAEHHFVEVAEGVIVEFDEDNQPIGIEIFNALTTIAGVIGHEFQWKESAFKSVQSAPKIR